MARWFVILAFLTWINSVLAQRPCYDITYCVEGQKCDGDMCIPCEHGTFRSELIHQFHFCEDWKSKPPGPYWEIKKQGTLESDVIWGCEEGTQEIRTTQWESLCVKKAITTTILYLQPFTIIFETPPTQSINFTPPITSTTPEVREQEPSKSPSQNFDVIVLMVIFVVIVLALVQSAAILYIFRKLTSVLNSIVKCMENQHQTEDRYEIDAVTLL